MSYPSAEDPDAIEEQEWYSDADELACYQAINLLNEINGVLIELLEAGPDQETADQLEATRRRFSAEWQALTPTNRAECERVLRDYPTVLEELLRELR